jgi:hypothetical protein
LKGGYTWLRTQLPTVCALVRLLPSHAPHAPHAPLTPLPFHFHSAAELLRSRRALDKEKEKLAHTNRLAELLAEENAKERLLLEEEERLLALVKNPSVPRKRWIKAITTVLVRNYTEKGKARVLSSNSAGWYKEKVAEQSLLQLQVHQNSATFPLSPSKHIPNLLKDPMERRRQSKAERSRKLGKLGPKPMSLKLQPLTAKTTPLLKSSSLVQVLRATSSMPACDLQRILAPHLFEVVNSLTVAPALSPVKSPKAKSWALDLHLERIEKGREKSRENREGHRAQGIELRVKLK